MAALKEFKKDKLSVYVFDSRKAMGDKAGYDAATAICKILETKECANVMFAAAPSQNETLAALLADTRVDWTRVNAFHMDEYVNIDPSHKASFRNFLKKAIFDVKPFRNVFLINGNAESMEEEEKRYSELLKANPLDVCLLGIGENGHIAFNDPSVADFNDPKSVKIVELEEVCRMQQVHDGCFDSLDEVPKYAYTVTIPALLDCGCHICTVPAPTKANAVKAMLEWDINEKCPCTALRNVDNAGLYLDQDSSSLIM